MIKHLLLILFISTCILADAQQASSESRQISVQNGVVNYETAGVEGFHVPQPELVSIVKPVSEWDLQQCTEMLVFTDQKLLAAVENNDQESIDHYQYCKDAILARIAALNNQIQGQ